MIKDQNSEKMTTEITISELPKNAEIEYLIQFNDLEKRVLFFVFLSFVVGVASFVI